MKIKFFVNQVNNPYTITINPLFFFIKTYYDLYGMNPNIEWSRCEHVIFDSIEDSAAAVVREGIDLVGLSVFIWNEDYQFSLARRIKQLNPEIVIVFGGPQLDAHKNPKFFHKHPYVDWVCYGDGEQAFQLLIDKISGHYSGSLVNMVENQQGHARMHEYQTLSDAKYFSVSALLAQKDTVRDTVQYLNQHNIHNSQLYFAVEFARGCMYSCSFCDWSQNLTKKVKRRTHDWRAEIDFLHELDVGLRETDANFGQWREDIEIFDYAVSLYNPDRNFKLSVSNTSKLNKDATFHIMSTQAKVYDSPAVVSIQDFDPNVLQKIDRPGLTYEQQIEFINRLKTELHDKSHLIYIQIIIGLPGQTYTSIKDTIIKTLELGISNHMIFPFAYLINSPAAEKIYQIMHGLKWKKTFGINGYFESVDYGDLSVTVDDLDRLYQQAINNQLTTGMWATSTTVYQTNSLSFYDYICAHIFITLIKQAQHKIVRRGISVNYKKLSSTLDTEVFKLADRYMQVHRPFIEKYGAYMMAMPSLDNNNLTRFFAII